MKQTTIKYLQSALTKDLASVNPFDVSDSDYDKYAVKTEEIVHWLWTYDREFLKDCQDLLTGLGLNGLWRGRDFALMQVLWFCVFIDAHNTNEKMQKTKPQPMMLSEAVFKFGMKGGKTKKDVAKAIVNYYKRLGIKTTKGLKKSLKNKIDNITVDYIDKFIDTVTVDFTKPTGWRRHYRVVKGKNIWKIVSR